ncbi:MAG: hypothetical protein LBU28_07185 [Spirochaetaceae bacterium]|nr:hypothetical protein [Spirochaetaceae bacterium]
MTARVLGKIGILSMVLLSSCIGLSADIAIRRDGSGTIALEYRISAALESLGKLDGNEGTPLLPVGRTDFERTAARIPGLALRSFSTGERNGETVVKAALGFSDLEALTAFLDALGQGARLSREQGRFRLSLTLGGGLENQDQEFLDLLRAYSQDAALDLSFTLPAGGTLTLRDREGRAIAAPPGGSAVLEGRKLRFASPLGDLLTAPAITLELEWAGSK